jgi:hypothetical protein
MTHVAGAICHAISRSVPLGGSGSRTDPRSRVRICQCSPSYTSTRPRRSRPSRRQHVRRMSRRSTLAHVPGTTSEPSRQWSHAQRMLRRSPDARRPPAHSRVRVCGRRLGTGMQQRLDLLPDSASEVLTGSDASMRSGTSPLRSPNGDGTTQPACPLRQQRVGGKPVGWL